MKSQEENEEVKLKIYISQNLATSCIAGSVCYYAKSAEHVEKQWETLQDPPRGCQGEKIRMVQLFVADSVSTPSVPI